MCMLSAHAELDEGSQSLPSISAKGSHSLQPGSLTSDHSLYCWSDTWRNLTHSVNHGRLTAMPITRRHVPLRFSLDLAHGTDHLTGSRGKEKKILPIKGHGVSVQQALLLTGTSKIPFKKALNANQHDGLHIRADCQAINNNLFELYHVWYTGITELFSKE